MITVLPDYYYKITMKILPGYYINYNEKPKVLSDDYHDKIVATFPYFSLYISTVKSCRPTFHIISIVKRLQCDQIITT